MSTIEQKQEKRCNHLWQQRISQPYLVKCMLCGLVVENPLNKNREEEESARKNYEDMGFERPGHDNHNR